MLPGLYTSVHTHTVSLFLFFVGRRLRLSRYFRNSQTSHEKEPESCFLFVFYGGNGLHSKTTRRRPFSACCCAWPFAWALLGICIHPSRTGRPQYSPPWPYGINRSMASILRNPFFSFFSFLFSFFSSAIAERRSSLGLRNILNCFAYIFRLDYHKI